MGTPGGANKRLDSTLSCGLARVSNDGDKSIWTELMPSITDCRAMEERLHADGMSSDIICCFYQQPCKQVNKRCGRCGLKGELRLAKRQKSIWRHKKEQFRYQDVNWWRMHTAHT